MKMIYGLVTSSLGGTPTLPGKSLEEALRLCEWLCDEVGMRSIEISLAGNMYRRTGPELFPWEIDEEKKTLLLDFLASFEVKGGHLPFKSLPSVCQNPRIEKESRYQMKLGIEKSSDLGLDYVVAHLWGNTDKAPEGVVWQAFKEVTLECLDCAKTNGINLTLENSGFLNDLSNLAGMIKEIKDPHLKATLDTGHAYRPVEGRPPYHRYGSIEKFIEIEGNSFNNVHAHDYDGRMDHLPIGIGMINFENIIKSLKKVGYQGPVNIEFGSRRLREIVKAMESPPSSKILSKHGLMMHYIVKSIEILRSYE